MTQVTDNNTQIGIIGAGPAGLLLGHLLRQAGLDAIIIERQTCAHVEGRIRAGVLEEGTANLLAQLGLDHRFKTEGLPHDGLTILHNDVVIPIEVHRLTGKRVTVYGQTEITRDLIDAASSRGLPILWGAEDVTLHDIATDTPFITLKHDGSVRRITCRAIAGCDGFHGVARASLPSAQLKVFDQAYPFGWLGVLADVPPCHHEVIYSNHHRGFALASMRSPTRSRYYVQVRLDERIEDWPDDRFWEELCTRLGKEFAGKVTTGPSIEKSIAPLRSFVCETMQHGRLFLAGDAAHIVPPTGAKGLNLAASDVVYLASALTEWLLQGRTSGVEGYAERALARIWKVERFSWSLTRLLHQFPEDNPFQRRMQSADLAYLAQSEAARASIAENYVGLPL